MPVRATYEIIAMLIVLLVLIILGSVFKDFIFQFGSLLGISFSSAQDSSIGNPNVAITCKGISVNGMKNPIYDYSIKISKPMISLGNANGKTVNLAISFKGRTATSKEKTMQISDKGTTSPAELNFNIQKTAEPPTTSGKEFFVISAYEQNDRCYSLGQSDISPTTKQFVSNCASNFLSSTSFTVNSPVANCQPGGQTPFSCSFLSNNERDCIDQNTCHYDSISGDCEECPDNVVACTDKKINYATWCKCGLQYGMDCYWDSPAQKCSDCIYAGRPDADCKDFSRTDCLTDACGKKCGWDDNSGKCYNCDTLNCQDITNKDSCAIKICNTNCKWDNNNCVPA